MYIRVAQKYWKFFDSGQMMDEVIIKWFYLYYFWFHQPYAPAMPKNHNQKILNAAETYYIFFLRILALGQNKENELKPNKMSSLLLCAVFLQIWIFFNHS